MTSCYKLKDEEDGWEEELVVGCFSNNKCVE